MSMRKCAACGRILARDRRAGTKFCGPRCRMRLFRAERRQPDVESLTDAAAGAEPGRRCAACGRQIASHKRKGTRFCAKRCATRFYSQKGEATPPPADTALAPGLGMALLILMRSRGADLPTADEARILACKDSAVLCRAIQRMAGSVPGSPALTQPTTLTEGPSHRGDATPIQTPAPINPSPQHSLSATSEIPLGLLPAVPVPAGLAAGLSLIADQLPILSAVGQFRQQLHRRPAVSAFLDGIQMIGSQVRSVLEKVRASTQRQPVSESSPTVLRMLLLEDILPALDNLYLSRRALHASAVFAHEHALRDLSALIVATFLSVLRQERVFPLDPAGEPFDPRFHEAVQLVEHPGVRPGTIAAVIQPGFWYGENLLRVARVAVVGSQSAK